MNEWGTHGNSLTIRVNQAAFPRDPVESVHKYTMAQDVTWTQWQVWQHTSKPKGPNEQQVTSLPSKV